MDQHKSPPLESLIDHLTKLSDELSHIEESTFAPPLNDDRGSVKSAITKPEKDTNNEH